MSEKEETLKQSPERGMLHGSIWMILLRWTLRTIGLISTIILARLLTPADFGIVSIAMIVVGMLEVLSQAGQKLALIRMASPTDEDYDTAWTISVLVGLIVGTCIFIAAPFTQVYFHEPRAVVVMQCLALRAVFGGFENIGVVDFRRDIRFDRFFRYNAYPKLISFCVTISAAWYFRNYWALVAGILSGQLSTIILSYCMSSYRPWFSLARISSLFSFSAWTLIRSIGVYLNSQVDQIVIGGITGAAAMGRYAVANDVASSPSREINDPMVAVLYPVMAKLRTDMGKLRATYLRTLGWSALICSSASIGVCLIAPEIVRLVLGPQWLDAIPLMGWLALSAGLLGLSSGSYGLFDLIGKPQIGARMQWVRLALLAIAITPVGFATHDLVAIAATRLVVTALFIPTLLLAAAQQVQLSTSDLIGALWRPLLAGGVMALVVTTIDTYVSLHGPEKLAFDIFLGAATYALAIFVLWIVSGLPDTPEQDIVRTFRTATRKLRSPVHLLR